MIVRLTPVRPTLLLGGTFLATLLLAGCGTNAGTSNGATGRSTPTQSAYGPSAAGPHNDQDVAFATQMLPHHAQAVEMADMALSREVDPQVKALARQIKAAQAPEIQTMSGWLAGWGKPVPAAGGHGMAGMGHDSTDMHGMMSDSAMTKLDAADGTPFGTLWVTGMTAHHKGAVEMARAELASGQNAQAKMLASSIIAAQSRELVAMTALLPRLG